MIYSMTGFGHAEKQLPDQKIVVEIRSVNSKIMDINIRMPQAYRAKEADIKSLVSKQLGRGKVDVTIFVEKTTPAKVAVINTPVIEQYMATLQSIVKAESIEYLKLAIKMPDSIKVTTEILDDFGIDEILGLTQTAIDDLLSFRIQEGAALGRDLSLRISVISKLLASISEFDKVRITSIRQKFEKHFNTLKLEVDANRLEQELIYYIEKLDITEEQVRLKTHLDYFLKIFNQPDSGRKLGFICQEIGREINTIGSKSNHADMQRLVVEMKDELEKIKEQVLNVL